MKLDRNYNIKTQSSGVIYRDSFDEIVELIATAQEEGKINKEETKFILGLAILKHSQKEIQHLFNSMFRDQGISEKQTLLVELKSKYAW